MDDEVKVCEIRIATCHLAFVLNKLNSQPLFGMAALSFTGKYQMIFSLFSFPLALATEEFNDEWMKFAWWWSVPLMIVGFCALPIVIFKLVKMIGDARICRAPLAAENELDITATGKLNLCLEIPMFTIMATSGLNYELFDRQRGGQTVELKTAWLKTQTNSGSAVTSPVRVFQIAEPGKYLLKVSGFDPQKDYSRYFVVVSRPINLISTLFVFAILLTGLMFIAGLVFTLIASGANK